MLITTVPIQQTTLWRHVPNGQHPSGDVTHCANEVKAVWVQIAQQDTFGRFWAANTTNSTLMPGWQQTQTGTLNLGQYL